MCTKKESANAVSNEVAKLKQLIREVRLIIDLNTLFFRAVTRQFQKEPIELQHGVLKGLRHKLCKFQAHSHLPTLRLVYLWLKKNSFF